MYVMYEFLKALSNPSRNHELKAANINPLHPQLFTYEEASELHALLSHHQAMGKVCEWHYYTSDTTSLIAVTKGDVANNGIMTIRKFRQQAGPFTYAFSCAVHNSNGDTRNFKLFVKTLENELEELPEIVRPQIRVISHLGH